MDFQPNTTTYYFPNGKTICGIHEHDPATGNFIKSTWYNKDGITIDCITEYDPITEEPIKSTWFNENGTVERERF